MSDFDRHPATTLGPFLKADGSGQAEWQTQVRLSSDPSVLHVRFDCQDVYRWATFEQRDDPLWQEEVVEIFIAPGNQTPTHYFEIELNPLSALFDARVFNPSGVRSSMRVDTDWDCPDIHWRVGLGSCLAGADQRQDWWAELSLPWRSLVADAEPLPSIWRANFLRVERPLGPEDPSADEYSCWSPTLRHPADFHVPDRFGWLLLDGADTPITDLPVVRVPQRLPDADIDALPKRDIL